MRKLPWHVAVPVIVAISIIMWAVLLLMIVLFISAVVPSCSNADTIQLEIVAPTTNYVGPGCPDIDPFDPTGSYRTGPPLTDLKEIIVRGVRLDQPGDTLEVGRFPAAAGDTIGFDFEAYPGVHYELLTYAADTQGNRSCVGAQYVGATPADSTWNVAPGLVGAYYRDKVLGALVGTRVDLMIDFDWATGSPFPGCPADSFSVRWTGNVAVAAAGTYRFRMHVNDACRVWVGGVKILDDWATGDGWHYTPSASVVLPKGSYPLVVEMKELWYICGARLLWTPPAGLEAVVPATALSH